MKTALVKRLKRLEEVRAIVSLPPVEFEIGYVKKLPQEYTGERHVVTVGRDTPQSWRSTSGSTAPAPGARESYRETDSDIAA